MQYSQARKAMIDSQLRTSGINEPFVLSRMGTVPREDFVPENVRSVAYMDRSLPLGDGRLLASPAAHGRLLAEANPRAGDRALVVENGNGYLAELVRPLVASLDTRDCADLAGGSFRGDPYDLVLIDGAIEDVPRALVRTVADNGRVVTGLIENGVPRLAVGRKAGDTLAFDRVADTSLPFLPAFARKKEWSF
jgi:protein-L-isoaspartate(D-aspartate) O-methyltransferase